MKYMQRTANGQDVLNVYYVLGSLLIGDIYYSPYYETDVAIV